jgi:hypothetical protein
VKTLVMGIVMGGMVSFGTYFLLPPPQSAKASDCATSYDLDDAVSKIQQYIMLYSN